MLRRGVSGKLTVYVAKKDLEEEVVQETESPVGRILTLANGWELEVAGLSESIELPKTVEAKRLA